MERVPVALLVVILFLGSSTQALAEDSNVTAILDKAMKAMGGENRLGKTRVATWKTAGKLTLGDYKALPFGLMGSNENTTDLVHIFPNLPLQVRLLLMNNGLLMNMFDVMNTARSLPVWGSLKRRTSTPERRRAYHEQHTAIVAALTERDPEHAEAVMLDHLRHVSEDMLGRH